MCYQGNYEKQSMIIAFGRQMRGKVTTAFWRHGVKGSEMMLLTYLPPHTEGINKEAK